MSINRFRTELLKGEPFADAPPEIRRLIGETMLSKVLAQLDTHGLFQKEVYGLAVLLAYKNDKKTGDTFKGYLALCSARGEIWNPTLEKLASSELWMGALEGTMGLPSAEAWLAAQEGGVEDMTGEEVEQILKAGKEPSIPLAGYITLKAGDLSRGAVDRLLQRENSFLSVAASKGIGGQIREELLCAIAGGEEWKGNRQMWYASLRAGGKKKIPPIGPDVRILASSGMVSAKAAQQFEAMLLGSDKGDGISTGGWVQALMASGHLSDERLVQVMERRKRELTANWKLEAAGDNKTSRKLRHAILQDMEIQRIMDSSKQGDQLLAWIVEVEHATPGERSWAIEHYAAGPQVLAVVVENLPKLSRETGILHSLSWNRAYRQDLRIRKALLEGADWLVAEMLLEDMVEEEIPHLFEILATGNPKAAGKALESLATAEAVIPRRVLADLMAWDGAGERDERAAHAERVLAAIAKADAKARKAATRKHPAGARRIKS